MAKSHRGLGRVNGPDRRRRKRAVIKAFGLICFHCNEVLTWETMTLDHVIPASKGGSNAIKNLVPACATCNHRRGNKSL